MSKPISILEKAASELEYLSMYRQVEGFAADIDEVDTLVNQLRKADKIVAFLFEEE